MVKLVPARKVTLCGASTQSVGSMLRFTAASSTMLALLLTAPPSARPRRLTSLAVDRSVSVALAPAALAWNTSSAALEAMVRLPSSAAASVTRSWLRPLPAALMSVMLMSPVMLRTRRSSATETPSAAIPVPALSATAPPATAWGLVASYSGGAAVARFTPLPVPLMLPLAVSDTSSGCAARSSNWPEGGSTTRSLVRPATRSCTARSPATVAVMLPSCVRSRPSVTEPVVARVSAPAWRTSALISVAPRLPRLMAPALVRVSCVAVTADPVSWVMTPPEVRLVSAAISVPMPRFPCTAVTVSAARAPAAPAVALSRVSVPGSVSVGLAVRVMPPDCVANCVTSTEP